MASMLEVLREYKHLATKKRTDGQLAPALQTRFEELEALVKAEAVRRKTDDLSRDAEASVDGDTPSGTRIPKADTGRLRSFAAPPPASGPVRRGRSASAREAPPSPTPAGPPAAPRARKPEIHVREQQELWAWAAVAVLFSAGLVGALLCGLGEQGGMFSLLEGVALSGIASWLIVYPGLMAWRELAARRSSAHLSEPDFRATTPVVEPVVALVAALAAVLWLMIGGYADEGLPRLLGYLLGLAFWLGALGWATALILRPVAARYARVRAFRQYLQGGAHALEKKNTKRARRLYELGLAEAVDAAEEQRAVEALGKAFHQEAEEFRLRGRPDRADDLMRLYRKTVADRTRSPPSAARPAAAPRAPEPDPPAPIPTAAAPRLLGIGDIHFETSRHRDGEPPHARLVADQLAAKGRHREALEYLLDAHLPVPREWGKPAAQEYIQQGLLRSADAVFDALSEPQIPEFYKAVAVELSRQEGAPPEPALRLAKILEELGELQAAARISCQGVLSGLGPALARRHLGELAVGLCQQLGQDPPAEILEAVDRFVAAGDAYRRAGDDAAARRCYQTVADRLIDQGDQRELLIPVLNRMFKLDRFLDERFLAVLVDDILETGATGSQATRILATHRARHREDARVAQRLFELFVDQGHLEEALRLLREMSASTSSNSEHVLRHFDLLRQRFPDDLRVEVGGVRALIKAGKVQHAAQQVQRLLPKVREEETAREVIELVDSVFEWGHPDPELRNGVGALLLRFGDDEAALVSFEQYVAGGGRDPEALSQASDILTGRLAQASGAPNHDAHLRLARFHLSSGSPQEAIPFLEVARASLEHRVDADLLLARAEVAASNPRRAVQVIRDAIDGRHPRDTPELHYELARVYDLLGERKKARQIDHALEEYAPEEVREYQESRLVLEKRDTEWTPGVHGDLNEAPGDTDVGAAPFTSRTVTEATFVDDGDDAMTLEEALAPRYRLSKRLGAGGIGDVHLARDEVLGRPVAIKVLRRTLATDLFISKFRDEARIVAKLSHPGIVSVYDIGQKRDWSYIVMEYVRGPNLSALVNASVPPSRQDLVRYVAAVADAMAYAHEQGVIHRDLKPANILIGHDGKVKVTDFGIAHVLHGDGSEETAFSAAGLQVGTVNYMAPEQLRGAGIDARTDIYLLGTTLYYTLCRRYPYMGDAVAIRKLREPPTPLTRYVPDVSPDLDACVQRCIAREPEDRFQKMDELSLVLRMVPESQPTL